MQLVAKVSPEHTTYPEVCFAIVEGGTFATITSGGLLKINQDADVGAIIKIIARTTLDTVLSAEYSVTVLKVPVEYVCIWGNATTSLVPSETLQFTHEVSANATYSTVTYAIIDGDEYASITSDGLLTINASVMARFATVNVIGTADNVVSNVYQISIYNPAQSVVITADKTTIRRGEVFALSSVVNEFATSRDVRYSILSGVQFVTVLGDGLYIANDNITVPNAQITLQGYIDEVYSEVVEVSVYIEVSSIAITDYATIVEPNTDTWLSAVVTPSFATNTQITYYLTCPIDGVALDANTSRLSISSDVPHNTQIHVYAVSADGNVSETVTIEVKIADISISATDLIVSQGDYVRIYENFEYLSFASVNYVVLPISHSALNFASLTVVGEIAPQAYLSIADVVSVRNYTFSVQALADDLLSNVLYFTVYIPVTHAVLSADNYVPTSTTNAGSSVVLSVETNQTATNQAAEYVIISGSEYVESIASGILTVKANITVSNAKIVIAATIDGYTPEYIILSVKVPVSNVVLNIASGYTQTNTVQQGEWVNLQATAYPLYASDRHAIYSVATGGEYAEVDQNGFVTVYQNAMVGAEIQIIAIADGVASVPYSITVSKVPVTSLYIEPTFVSDLKPCESMQFIGTVNGGNYATYSEIKYYVESDEWATITRNGMLTINATINNRFAKVLVYGIADGYRSESYTISVYNPATLATLTADKVVSVRPSEIIEFTTAVNAYATIQTVEYIVPHGEDYLVYLGDGKYSVKEHSEIRLSNASFTVYARHVDGIDSNYLSYNIVIDVEDVALKNTETTVIQGNVVNIAGQITPEYATGSGIVYALRNSVSGVTINSTMGEISVAGEVPLGELITVYAQAVVGGVVVCESEDIVITVVPVAVDTITLNLPGNMTLSAGAQISLIPTVLPHLASTKDYNAVSYFVSNTSVLNITNGTLKVAQFGESLVGQTITLYAKAGGVQSQTYTVTLAHTSVSEVTLTAENNITTIAPGEGVELYASIAPNTATVQNPVLLIISGDSFGYLDGYFLRVYSTTKHNSKIVVQACADNMSATYEIIVRVPSISINASKTVLSQGEQVQITGINNAFFNNVTYMTTGYSAVSTSGLVSVNSTVYVRNAQFTVTVTVDDLPSRQLIFTIYIPVDVKKMTVAANGMTANPEAKLGTRISLSTVVNSNATNQMTTYSIVSGASYGVLSGNTFTLNSPTSDINPMVTLKATISDNGILREKTIAIKIIVPVVSVGLNCSVSEINPNKSYVVTATVLPTNATYKNVTFELPTSVIRISSTSESVEFKVNSETTNGDILIRATSASYTINGTSFSETPATAKILTVKRILASSVAISAVKTSDGKIIDSTNNANKARTGDTLMPVVNFAPADVSSTNYELSLNSNAFAIVSTDKKSIIVRGVSHMTNDNPSFIITATSTDGSGKTATWSVTVYVPVVSITKSTATASRNSTTSLGVSYNVAQNGGYATTKIFTGSVTSVTNSKVSISNGASYYFSGINLIVPKNAPGGTVINIRLVANNDTANDTSDDTILNTSVTVSVLSLSSSNVYYNTNISSYSSASVDSAGRTMLTTDSAQLEEGKYTYVLGKYNNDLITNYGVEYTVELSTSVAKSATLDATAKKLTIAANASGSAIVTLKIKFTDGTGETSVTKKINVFNAINDASMSTNYITSRNTTLTVSSNDSLSSNSSNTFAFTEVSETNYSLTAGGYLTINDKSVNGGKINVVLSCYQYYNGIKLKIWTKIKSVAIDINKSKTVRVYDGDSIKSDEGMGLIFTKNYSIGLDFTTLRALGYKSITITMSLEIRAQNKGDGRVIWFDINNAPAWYDRDVDVNNTSWHTLTFSTTVSIGGLSNSAVFRFGFNTRAYVFSDGIWYFNTANVTFTAI
jgi:hypothetical protein